MAEPRGLRHWLGFLASGTGAFLTDAAVLKALLLVTALSPLLCRLISIPTAMLVGWQLHRRFTFGLQGIGTAKEFLHFASVGWGAAALNYAVFVGLLLGFPRLPPLAALVASSAVAMAFSYLGYRFFVFRRRP